MKTNISIVKPTESLINLLTLLGIKPFTEYAAEFDYIYLHIHDSKVFYGGISIEFIIKHRITTYKRIDTDEFYLYAVKRMQENIDEQSK